MIGSIHQVSLGSGPYLLNPAFPSSTHCLSKAHDSNNKLPAAFFSHWDLNSMNASCPEHYSFPLLPSYELSLMIFSYKHVSPVAPSFPYHVSIKPWEFFHYYLHLNAWKRHTSFSARFSTLAGCLSFICLILDTPHQNGLSVGKEASHISFDCSSL